MVWNGLALGRRYRKCTAMRPQGHTITRGFTATGSSRTSLDVFFLFFFVEQRSLDSWSTASLYLCFAPWISGNHWKPLMHCFFSTRTMIVTVSEQTRRLRSDSQVILGRYPRESLMLWRKLGDFDRQILTRTKSPADRGVAVMGQWWNVLFCFNRI